jgi:sugar-specific transcriptional regulator TrmB
MNIDKHIQLLHDFGLTCLQAKIYLILLQFERADAKTIARASNLARQEIYRLMPSLQELGLAEKIISKPVNYKATTLDNALSILLEKQKKDLTQLEDKRSWLLQNVWSSMGSMNADEDDAQFIVVSEIKSFINTHEKLCQNTKQSIDIIVPFITMGRFSEMWNQLERTLRDKKTLKVRLLTLKSTDETELPRAILENSRFECRHLNGNRAFGMHIFDKRELTMSISENRGLPSLWSNNPNLMLLAQDRFNFLWDKSTYENASYSV